MTRIFKRISLSIGTQLSIGVGVMTLTLLWMQNRTSLEFATERAKNEALSALQLEADRFVENVGKLESQAAAFLMNAKKTEVTGDQLFEVLPDGIVYRSYLVDEDGVVRDDAFIPNPKKTDTIKPERFIPEISYVRVLQEGKSFGDLEGRVLEADDGSQNLFLFSTREKIVTGNKKNKKEQTRIHFVFVPFSGIDFKSTAPKFEIIEPAKGWAPPKAAVEYDAEKKPRTLSAVAFKDGAFGVKIWDSWYTVEKLISNGRKKAWIRIGLGSFVAFLLTFLFSRLVLKKVTEDVAKKTILEQELKVASAVQESLFPAGVFEADEYQIYGKYLSAAICGGDWWSHFTVDRKLCFMVADATGHGVSSALITASARGAFSVIQKFAESDPTFPFSPGLMMDLANRVVYDSAKTKVMMTAFIGVIDLDENKLIYSNASHNPPWLFRASPENGQTESLVPDGLRLGEEESPPQYAEFEVSLSPGDTIVFYTDGYLENQNLKGEIYGKKRARKKIEENLGTHPKDLIDSLVVDFKAFNGDKPLDDDATLAAIRIRNPSTSASV